MKYEVHYKIINFSFKENSLTQTKNDMKKRTFEGQENESMYYRAKKELAMIHGVDQREIRIAAVEKIYDH